MNYTTNYKTKRLLVRHPIVQQLSKKSLSIVELNEYCSLYILMLPGAQCQIVDGVYHEYSLAKQDDMF